MLRVSNLTPHTFSPLQRLRFLIHARKSTLFTTAGFTGAGYTFLSLGTPLRLDSKESSTMAAAASDNEEVRGRTQQSPLASQRAKEEGQQPGRFAQWFPLSAKEGFTQWVCSPPCATKIRRLTTRCSGLAHRQWPPNTASFPSSPTCRNRLHIHRLAPRPSPRHPQLPISQSPQGRTKTTSPPRA